MLDIFIRKQKEKRRRKQSQGPPSRELEPLCSEGRRMPRKRCQRIGNDACNATEGNGKTFVRLDVTAAQDQSCCTGKGRKMEKEIA
jgi:hypothetical protein